MNHRRRSAFPPLAALSALAALALHCTGDSGDGPAAARAVSSGRQLQISDALHSGGTRGFYWLPPVVPRAAYRGDFLPDLDPRVRIDELRPDGTVARTLATFTRSTGPGGERVRVHLERGGHDPDDHDRDDDPSGYYYVRWSTHCAALSPAATYRIRAQALPQAPQCETSPASVTSQPLASTPSQLARPAAHTDAVQAPERQVRPSVQALPQAPQFASSLATSCSQPLAGEPSQSAHPAAQARAQAPAAQVGAAWGAAAHATPQAPQSLSVRVERSQPLPAAPSQSA